MRLAMMAGRPLRSGCPGPGLSPGGFGSDPPALRRKFQKSGKILRGEFPECGDAKQVLVARTTLPFSGNGPVRGLGPRLTRRTICLAPLFVNKFDLFFVHASPAAAAKARDLHF
jgi:hypothetical protein